MIQSPGIDVAVEGVCDDYGDVVERECLTLHESAAGVGVLASELHETIGKVPVVVDAGPAVVQSCVVVERQDLLRMELRSKERVVGTLHRGDKGVTRFGISRRRCGREHLA